MRTVDPAQPHAALIVVVLGAIDGIGAELCRRRAAKETHLVTAGLDEAKEELKEVEVEDILERAHRQVRVLLTAKKSLL